MWCSHSRAGCKACSERAAHNGRAVTLAEVARELGVSIERARQIEARAIQKVRRALIELGVRRAEDWIADEPKPRYRPTAHRGHC